MLATMRDRDQGRQVKWFSGRVSVPIALLACLCTSACGDTAANDDLLANDMSIGDLVSGDDLAGAIDLSQPPPAMFDLSVVAVSLKKKCNGLVNDAPEATIEGDLPIANAPTPAGGVITPGVYVATKVQTFGGPTSVTSFRAVRLMTGTTIEFSAAVNGSPTRTESRSYTLSGTQLLQTTLCPQMSSSMFPSPYTASQTSLVIGQPSFDPSAVVFATYTRR